jgi:hypothetical protein
MFSNLPNYIMGVIRGIITENPVTNASLSVKVWQNSKSLWDKSWKKERVLESLDETQLVNVNVEVFTPQVNDGTEVSEIEW